MATVDNIKVDDCTKHGEGVMVYFPEGSGCPLCSMADALEGMAEIQPSKWSRDLLVEWVEQFKGKARAALTKAGR